MTNVRLILALCLLSGFLGLTLPDQQAHADDPVACDQYNCKNVSYWWEGDANIIKCAAMPGKDVASTHSLQSIFTDTSTFDTPVAASGNMIDIRTYAGCIPKCGKDAAGVWQAYQEVDKMGPSTVLLKDQAQWTCTDLGKVVGRKQVPQINANKGKKLPPKISLD